MYVFVLRVVRVAIHLQLAASAYTCLRQNISCCQTGASCWQEENSRACPITTYWDSVWLLEVITLEVLCLMASNGHWPARVLDLVNVPVPLHSGKERHT